MKNIFNTVERKIKVLNRELSKLDTYIINREEYDHKHIQRELFRINKLLLVVKLTLSQLKIRYENNDNVQRKINHFESRTKFFTENAETIKTFTNARNVRKQEKNIDLLTIINMIFLPLGVITGYFGMNFASMGNPDVQKGILSVKSGQGLVWGLFVLCGIIITIVTLKYM